jgi:hypothetical protein
MGGMLVPMDDPGEGALGALTGLPNWFPRSHTAEITNDPRVFSENVIEKRFAAFETIVVSAILLAGMSCTAILEAPESAHTTISVGYVAVWTYVLCFSFNMICVLVLTIQYYQSYRLMTAGSTGFETCKEYYMNPAVNEMRHLGAKMFFWSIPLFLVGIGLEMFHRLTVTRAMPLLIMMVGGALVMGVIIFHHMLIFQRKYQKSKAYEAQQFAQLDRMAPMRSQYEAGFGVSGV